MQLRTAPAGSPGTIGYLDATCGVAAIGRVPAATAARARAIEPSVSPGRSSMPGRPWQ
jgi:hypothetical protein